MLGVHWVELLWLDPTYELLQVRAAHVAAAVRLDVAQAELPQPCGQ